MKSDKEVIREFWDEDREIKKLFKEYEGNEELVLEADYLFQEGVRVDEIRKIMLEMKEKQDRGEKLD